MHTPVARTACALRILLLTSAFGREKALPALLECPVNRHQHEHLVDPQVTKTQSSGEGCKILFSESIRERAVFNGVRGSRRHRASGALDPVRNSFRRSLTARWALGRAHEVRVLQQEASSIVEEPSRWTARQRRIARRGDSAMRARQQPVSCTLVPAAVSGLQEECCGGAKERGLQRIQCAGVVLSCPCCVGALRMICGQPVGRLCARLVT